MSTDTKNENHRKDDVRPAHALNWADTAPAGAQLADVMIDAETAGTTPGSAILSIGAVTFGAAGLGAEFYAPISLASCTAVGLTIDPATVAWWMKQSDVARAAAFRDDAEPLPVVLQQFTRWLNLVEAERPWAQGANFDPPLLEAAYRACGMTPPWKFWNVRDTRRLYEVADVKVNRARGTHHNALDDARAQAEAAVVALQRLRGRIDGWDGTAAAGEAADCPKCMGFGWQPGVYKRQRCGHCKGSATNGSELAPVITEITDTAARTLIDFIYDRIGFNDRDVLIGEVQRIIIGCMNASYSAGLRDSAALAQQARAPALLNAEELAALRRFNETCEDGEGYDVRKPMMQRLAEIGAVRRTSGSYYEITDFGMHVLGAAPAPAAQHEQTQAARDVLAERRRQVDAEGWTPQHDDKYSMGELATAAACYALTDNVDVRADVPQIWPWPAEWWKPSDERRNLVKAGALILADIERIDRAAMSQSKTQGAA